MEVKEICKLTVSEDRSSFNPQVQQAIDASVEAMNRSHAPYSHFRVGAAVLYDDGTLSSGSNQENPSFPSGLCAERVVLFNSMANHPDKRITHLVISTSDENNLSHPFAPPCGACLQVIDSVEHRQQNPITIILCGLKEFYVAEGVRQFLPFRFNF
ncbi:MAG: cytidine deaminase [Bacteroidetes bacterium]|nr:cytidine deaminase [Bacteroidota bacterium]